MNSDGKATEESALRLTEEKFAKVWASIPHSVSLTILPEGRLVDVNRGFENVTGHSRDEAIGRTTPELDLWPDPEKRMLVVDEGIRRGEVNAQEVPFRRKDGEVRIGLLWGRTLEIGGRLHALTFMQDVTEQRRLERAIAEREAFYAAVLERSPDVALVIGTDRKLRFVSSAEAVLGIAPRDLDTIDPLEVVHPEDRARLVQAFAQIGASPHGTAQLRFRVRHANGGFRTVDAIARNHLDDPIVRGVIINARDVTEQVALEAHRQHAQRLELLGRLVSGIAHDYSNLLAGIVLCTEITLDSMKKGMTVDPAPLEDVLMLCRQAGEMMAAMLAFCRREAPQTIVVDVNENVRSSARLLSHLVGRVRVVVSTAPGSLRIRCGAGQLEQIIFNAAVNARDAMPKGGTFVLETSVLADEGEDIPGTWVCLSVRDTGVGIAPEVLAHLFDPFFTTKGPGQGTGLGLAIVRDIIEQNGGRVRVQSELGQGTRFDFLFPAVSE